MIERLLGTCPLLLLVLIKNNGSLYAQQAYEIFSQTFKKYDGKPRTSTTFNKTLARLEDQGYLMSVEEFGDESRGVPQRRFYLTAWGLQQLDATYDIIAEIEEINFEENIPEAS